MIANQNFRMASGDTRTLTFTVRDDGGAVVDLTGATLKWVLGKNPRASADITKTTSSGITVSSPTTGVAVVTISASDTTDLDGVYYHELQVTDSSSRVVTVAKGRATIDADLA
jgi:hypothetical protein